MDGREAQVEANKPDEEEGENIPIHGYMFQLKLLVLFMCRGLSGGHCFKLGTEIKQAGKFDDVVLEFKQDGKKYYRLLQAKHKLDKTRNSLTTNLLLKKMKSEFYLPKYFYSYLDSKQASLFSEGIIKDVIIYTNINFDDQILKNKDIEVLNDKDEILDTNIGCLTKPVRYRFTEKIVYKLKKPLNDYKSKSKKVLSDYSDEDIKDFINHLTVAVDSPSEQELDGIIKREIGKQFEFLSNDFSVENTYCTFMMTMLDWLQGKVRGRFMSDEEGKRFFEEAKRGIPVIFNIKSPVESFTGRAEELDLLYDVLKVCTKRAICISGIGGVGKSELARKYISKFRTEYNNNVLWFNAESYQALESSFRSLASEKLGIATKNADGEGRSLKTIVEDVYRAFLNRKYLLVFDDAQHYQSKNRLDGGLDQFLPPFSDHDRPCILITSRNQRWPSNIHVLSLDKFRRDEAIEFISKVLEADNSNDCSSLASEMDCFPLALQQAVSYIKVQNIRLKNIGSHFDIPRYLNHFKEKVKHVLNFSFPEDSDIDYAKTVSSTWDVTLDLIRNSEYGHDALNIMYILSYMGPEDIPVELFRDLVEGNDEILSSALDILKQFSMISIHRKIISLEERVVVVSVHGLVQQVIRFKLEEENRDKIILDDAIMIFNDDKKINTLTLNHSISLWNYYIKNGIPQGEKRMHCLLISVHISTTLYTELRYIEVCSFAQNAIECFSSPSFEEETFLAVLKYAKGRALRQLEKDEDADRIMDEIIEWEARLNTT